MSDFYKVQGQMRSLVRGNMANETLALAELEYLSGDIEDEVCETTCEQLERECWNEAIVAPIVEFDGVKYRVYEGGNEEQYRTHDRSRGTFTPVWNKNSYIGIDGKLKPINEEYYGDLLRHNEVMYEKV